MQGPVFSGVITAPSRSRIRNIRRAVLGLAICSFIAACGEPVAHQETRLDKLYVTGAAADALREDGTFELPDSVVNPSGQLNASDARGIALRYVRDVSAYLAPQWAREHGAQIRVGELTVCGSPVYAASPYGNIIGEASEITQRIFGPHWVVPMCSVPGRVQVVVSFSSLADELRGLNDGDTVPYHRTDFLSFGVPVGAAGHFFFPEAAAAHAFAETGKRVASVPQVVMSPHPSVPALVRWRVTLESPVAVRGAKTGTTRDRNMLLVGFESAFSTSGLLDRGTMGPTPVLAFTDRVTGVPIQVPLNSSAPNDVERVTLRNDR